MADEVTGEAREEDVEGQVLRSGPEVRLAQDSARGSDAEPKMTESDDDVEGQVLRS
ncbi:MAG: hypothetical protein QOK06_2593 [Acidimicrobiaceae bacterium]|jgi:hypothetical protein